MQSDSKTVWFLSGNIDKFREARAILEPFGIRVRHLKRPKVEIQDSKLENIARHALKEALVDQGELTLVEDSGLFIEALEGFPGPYSSFVYGTIGLSGVLDLMRGYRNRRAFFQTTIAFGSAKMKPRLFTGRVRGRIARKILGSQGFGYDPIFIPDGSKNTFGQAGISVKNLNSHRARAFRSFARWFLAQSSRTVKK